MKQEPMVPGDGAEDGRLTVSPQPPTSPQPGPADRPAVINTAEAEELRAEIRRLRTRIPGLSGDSLDRARPAIRKTLVRLSELHSGGRPVPDHGDRVLSDQVVVLLGDCLPEHDATPQQTAAGLALATDLRRTLNS